MQLAIVTSPCTYVHKGTIKRLNHKSLCVGGSILPYPVLCENLFTVM